MESVRTACPADLTRCAELLAQARSKAAAMRGGAMLLSAVGADPDPAAVVERWSSCAQGRLLVGLYDGVQVGLAAGLLGPGPGPLGTVRCCYVEPECRSVGVGSALLATLLAWFAEEGCSGVDAQALPGDRDTKQLFERAGFKTRLLILNRPFG
jgi:GNAT superfamily N-acetyltransferase